MKLSEEVVRFKSWAQTRLAPEWQAKGFSHADAEWECDYPEWGSIYAAIADGLKCDAVLSDSDMRDLVYILARDNEDERVMEMLVSRPDITFALCDWSADEPQARWQLAVALGKIGSPAAKERLAAFATDHDEYVRRRARYALEEFKA